MAARKGVLPRGGAFAAVRVPTGRGRRCGAKGVVKAAEVEIKEELLGGTKLAAGSAGWGHNQRRLPLMRCSQRKTMVGKSRGLASLAGTVGRLLV
jgi:hypothetical protein